jgi:hypothetical protein
MIRRNILASATAVITSVIILMTGAQAFAASNGAGNALSISPVTQNLVIKAGTTDVVGVYIQNLTKQTATLQGIINDFTANPNESGAPAILLKPNTYAPTHSLKRFVTPLGSYTLQPGERKDVQVTITIPKGTAGGGYYGVVRFAPTSGSSGKNVTLSASVGSLILVTVPGNLQQHVTIAGFDASKNGKSSSVFLSNKSIDAVVRFQNEGNVQEQPFGTILLKKGGKTLSIYQVNNSTPRGNVLPNSIRMFSNHLTGLGSLGRYTLEGNFGYGTTGQLLSATTTFYVIPLALIIIAILVVLLILFAIFGLPRMIRSYDRSIVRKATGKGKRKK